MITLHHGTKAPRFHQISVRLRNDPNIEERSFSLVTSDGRSLDLIAPSVDVAHEWFRCLNFLIFDIYILREDLWKVWALMVIGEGIKDEVDDLEILDEILEDSIKEDRMSIRNFVTSWTSIQDPRFPSRRILKDIDGCLPGLRATCEYFTFQAFFCLMTSQENTAFDPCRSDEVYQDMTQPLSHYFIHASDHLNIISHATCAEDYLSSYQNDLRNGCRAIELHCWDGTTSPIVTSYFKHVNESLSPSPSGTSIEIPLEEVLNVIKKSAFVTSQYPLILFIENHCSLPMQEIIAYYALAVFGDKLVPANEIAYGSDVSGRHLPSPEDLFEKVILVISDSRHRYATNTTYDDDIFKQKSIRPVSPVVISSQRLSVEEDVQMEDVEEHKDGQEEDLEDEEEKKEEEEKRIEGDHLSSSVLTSVNEREQVVSTVSNQTTESFFHPNLRELATLISRNVFDLQSIHRLDLHNLLSFSEVDMLSYLSHKEAISLLQINSHHLRSSFSYLSQPTDSYLCSRVYPDNRIEECHFLDPVRAWSVGCSMVLIDYHNPPESPSDISALVGREKFQDNGGCGYVLKPSYLVAKGVSPFPPSSLSVHLLSAQWIPELPAQVIFPSALSFSLI